jgi:Rrf2 family protein
MMVDLAQRYDDGPVQIREIAKRQDISAKYLEQLIIPLKKANYVKSVRGPKGGHLLAMAPEEITVGEIVRTLENEISLVSCIDNPKICSKTDTCPTRDVWKTATNAIYNELNTVTLSELIKRKK